MVDHGPFSAAIFFQPLSGIQMASYQMPGSTEKWIIQIHSTSENRTPKNWKQ
jgi:hypothetical protein